jgi:GalNAc-alpha-(1->4)-GalNAc-alpha-(1->3)-diNAcBac-PP-undecaprenol alpha-1,4-N-acetyl-D-galactosaminyltransferase
MSRRILMLVSTMATGGSERVAAALVNAWAMRGDSVTLIATFSGRSTCSHLLASEVRLIYLADLVGGRTSDSGKRYWRRFWALRRLIRQLRADVAVSFLTNVNVAASLAAFGIQRHVFVSERSFPPARDTGWVLKALRHIAYQWTSGVVMQTHDGLRWLNAKIPRARGCVIPNPVLIPLPISGPSFHPDDFLSRDRRLLLAVGRLDKGKQFDQLIDAFATLVPSHSSWDLVILGEGPENLQLKQRVQSLGLARRVIMPGRAGNAGDWYRRADLFAMTSRYEGFPNTLAEAMAHGCPAVSYDCDTGPRDIIRHELDGLLVSPVGDVAGLARALDRLMGSDAERSKMGQRATEVRERYSLEKVLAMWDQLFDTGTVQ